MPDEHQRMYAMLVEELVRVIEELERSEIEYGLCGGLAVGAYGYVRATEDIDVLVAEEDLSALKEVAARCGFTFEPGRMEFDQAVVYRFTKIIPAADPTEASDVLPLDFIFVDTRNQEAWDSRLTLHIRGKNITLVSPRGLIVMKQLSHRLKDRLDIEYLTSLLELS